MATIEDLNNDYLKENNVLTKLTAPGGLKDKISKMEEDLALYARDFKVKQAEYEYAQSRNDKATENALKNDLVTLSKDILALRAKLEKANVFLDKQQKTVNDRFEDLNKDPDIKQKLDSILYKKYERKQKQEADKKKQLETIRQIVDAHPTVQSWLKGIEGYEKSIKKCDKIIDKYKTNPPSTPEEQQELDDAKDERADSEGKLSDRRQDLVDYFTKNHPEIDKEILKNIHSSGNIDRQIKGCDKSIANYSKAMDNLSIQRPVISRTEAPANNDLPAITEKPSWFHPIKRIKYAINERKVQKNVPVPVSKSTFLDDVKLSKDEYNAEIVQKYIAEKYKEGLHNAARPKEENSHERDD